MSANVNNRRFYRTTVHQAGYKTAVFISVPISSPRSTTALGYTSGCYRRPGLDIQADMNTAV